MEDKQIRFRDTWFVQAGIGIIPLSALPLTAVFLAGLMFHRNIEVGPMFLWFLLGAAFGCLALMFGIAGVVVQKLLGRVPPR
jgi:hypothetical protein